MTKRKRTNNDQHNTTSIQKTTDQPTKTRIIWFYKIVHHLVAIPGGGGAPGVPPLLNWKK
jgi:hypothetical protein